MCRFPAAAAATGTDAAYNLTTPTGVISGSLWLPSNGTQPPVVLIIAGSGPTDRNGNSIGLRTDTYRLLAVALAAVGIASVRYDKRGIAASAAAERNEADLRFDDYVGDAVRWAAKLRSDGQFGKIAIAGHSEGSLIGMIAAAQTPVDTFISLAGAGFPAADVLRTQLRPKLAGTPALAAASDRILDALTDGRTDADVPPDLATLYRSSVQRYLISWFRYDPRIEIAKLRCPVTIVQGTADIQVSTADAKALAAALPAAKLVIVDGMSHVLKAAPGQTAEQQVRTVYSDPTLPLESAVPQAIATALGLAG